MKKAAAILICLIITASKGFCYWQQVMPGVYMDNYSVQNNVIKMTYKYTREFQPLNIVFKQRNIDSAIQDMQLNCGTKTLLIKTTFYDQAGNVIEKLPDATKNATPDMLQYCQ